jgi:hypothetical protein
MTTPPQSPQQDLVSPAPEPFADHLHYDVRYIIHEYMVDNLPPVSSEDSFSGYVLSSKLAKREAQEAAAGRAARRLRDFQDEMTFKSGFSVTIPPVPLESTFSDLRNITISLPFQVLTCQQPGFPRPGILPGPRMQCYGFKWKNGVLQTLHGLLADHYDTVQVHFTGTPDLISDKSPVALASCMWAAMMEIQDVMDAMKPKEPSRARHLDKELKRAGMLSKNPALQAAAFAALIDRQGDMVNYTYMHSSYNLSNPPTLPIRTKAIVFSWDVRKPECTGVAPLKGKAFRLGKSERTGGEKLSGRSNMFYHIRTPDSTVVQIATVSPMRWTEPHEPIGMPMNMHGEHDYDDWVNPPAGTAEREALRIEGVDVADIEEDDMTTADCSSAGIGCELQMTEFI